MMSDRFIPIASAPSTERLSFYGLPADPLALPLLPSACRLLCSLGITENYRGFRYAAYAAALASLDQDRLLLVTKRIYPDVARRFGTSWSAVERDLRTVITVAWKRNPALLADFAQEHLEHKPTCARFLAILSRCLDPSGKLPNHISITALHEPTSA